MAGSYSLMTLTYRGDIEPFERLCESIDRLMPDLRHHVLIDRSDAALFARFAAPNRILVDCSTMLPMFHEFNLPGRRLWWRFPCRIVRGWIYQQLVKIQFAASLDDDAVILVDSDAVFLRPITPDQVFREDRVRLYQYPGRADSQEFCKWHNVALRSLGLQETGYTGYDYISTVVVWSPEIVRRMITKIESVTDRIWHDALIRNFRFSEYLTYGIFCDRVEGLDQAGVFVTDAELCHCSWHYDLSSEDGVKQFVEGIRDDQVAVLIQSNLKMREADRADIFRRFLAEHSA